MKTIFCCGVLTMKHMIRAKFNRASSLSLNSGLIKFMVEKSSFCTSYKYVVALCHYVAKILFSMLHYIQCYIIFNAILYFNHKMKFWLLFKNFIAIVFQERFCWTKSQWWILGASPIKFVFSLPRVYVKKI